MQRSREAMFAIVIFNMSSASGGGVAPRPTGTSPVDPAAGGLPSPRPAGSASVHSGTLQFLPARRYAITALAMALCLCVCLSVHYKSVFLVETSERTELVFGTDASFGLSYYVLF